jgi:hypothetical protein
MVIFLLRWEILEEVKKNLYIFGGGGEFWKNPIEKKILQKWKMGHLGLFYFNNLPTICNKCQK